MVDDPGDNLAGDPRRSIDDRCDPIAHVRNVTNGSAGRINGSANPVAGHFDRIDGCCDLVHDRGKVIDALLALINDLLDPIDGLESLINGVYDLTDGRCDPIERSRRAVAKPRRGLCDGCGPGSALPCPHGSTRSACARWRGVFRQPLAVSRPFQRAIIGAAWARGRSPGGPDQRSSRSHNHCWRLAADVDSNALRRLARSCGGVRCTSVARSMRCCRGIARSTRSSAA